MNEITTNMDFGAVWSRVFQPPDGPRVQAENPALLAEFLDGTAKAARSYIGLAQKTRGPVRQRLLDLAGDMARRRKKLEAEFFLLSGACFVPGGPGAPCPCPLDGLRARYNGALQAAREYEKAAALCRDERRADLFRACAEEERAHARAVAEILELAM